MTMTSLGSPHSCGSKIELRGRSQWYRQQLAAAGLHRMLALAISYPDPATIEAVRATALDLVGAETDGRLPSALHAPLRAFLRAWRMTSAADLYEEHSRLFLGGGLVPLREGGYGGGSRFAGQPVDIADINGFYLAFGFELADLSPVPPDHLGAQLEFLSLLLLKAAHAVRKGSLREVRTIERARRHFLNDHLGRWTGALAEALRDASAPAPYAALGELLRATITHQCRELRIRPLATGRGATRDDMDADRFECPLAAAAQDKSHGGVQ
jgi:TorA maturation chaperone TorD